MALYAVVKGDTVDGIAIADAPMETENSIWINIDDLNPRPGPGWKYVDGVLAAPIYPIVPPSKIITKVAFRFRFTDAEYAGILAAAKTDTEVQAWYDTFNMVATIDLDNQRTKDGVANLVSKNLLSQARADEILTSPVQSG